MNPMKYVKSGFEHLKNITQFVKDVANDPRIPQRDKGVVLALLALLLSPVDIIPDWIPVFGVMDDIVIAALILDYFFDVLDEQILLDHYPYGTKSFENMRVVANVVTFMTPKAVKDKIWKYQSTAAPTATAESESTKPDEPS